MIAINIHEAKTKLSALIATIEEKGDMVTICRNGKAVAQLGPVRRNTNPLRQNGRLKRVVFKDDPSTPLSAEEWPENLR